MGNCRNSFYYKMWWNTGKAAPAFSPIGILYHLTSLGKVEALRMVDSEAP